MIFEDRVGDAGDGRLAQPGEAMDVNGKVVAVTGGGGGIGRALALEAAARGAQAVAVSDIDAAAAAKTATTCGGYAWTVDASQAHSIRKFTEEVEEKIGPIALFCSNAGILRPGGAETSDDNWQACWDVNVMAHVHAVRALAGRMAERGSGHFLITVSAAGVLSQVDSASYAVTKHAALGLAEWLSIAWGDRGVNVSALCPQAVRTAMIERLENGGVAGLDGILEPEEVARIAFDGVAEERFLILPHPQVAEYATRKVADRDRWIRGMRRLRERFVETSSGTPAT